MATLVWGKKPFCPAGPQRDMEPGNGRGYRGEVRCGVGNKGTESKSLFSRRLSVSST